MENIKALNLNWGIQIYDRENNEVLFALYDENQQGPHRTPEIREQADTLVAFYNEHPRPYKTNDTAWLKDGYLPGGRGVVKVRIIECKPSSRCGSGWLVTASQWQLGRRPRYPSILVRELDSAWFEKQGDWK